MTMTMTMTMMMMMMMMMMFGEGLNPRTYAMHHPKNEAQLVTNSSLVAPAPLAAAVAAAATEAWDLVATEILRRHQFQLMKNGPL